MISVLLLRPEMALEFDVYVVAAKNALQPPQQLPRLFFSSGAQCRRKRPILISCLAHQSFGMFFQLRKRGSSWLVFLRPQLGLGDQATEVLVPDAIGDQKRVIGILCRWCLTDRQFSPDMRFDLVGFSDQMEPCRTIQAIPVEQCHPMELLRGASVGEGFWNRCSLQ